MKTVMKKMFCLLLVAVMLVSAVPVAFADDTVKCTHCDGTNIAPNQALYGKEATCDEPGTYGYYCHDCKKSFTHGTIEAPGHTWSDPYLSVEPTCTATGIQVKKCNICGETVTTNSSVSTIPHDFGDATCTDPAMCSVCGAESTDPADAALNHNWSNATCTAPKTCSTCGATEGEALGHTVNKDVCLTCGKDLSAPKELAPITWQIKNKEGGEVVKSGSFTPNGETAAAKDILYYHVFNKSNAWKDQYITDPMKVWSSKQGKDIGYSGSVAEGDTVTFVLVPKDVPTEDDKKEETGTSKVKVHVNLYNADTYKETKELVVFYDAPNTSVYHSISKHEDIILAALKEQFPKYTWGAERHIYKNIKSTEDFASSEDVDDGVTVYINAYSSEDFVFIMVHKSRTMNYVDVIPLHGVKFGDTVTKAEVFNAVNKYFHVNSLSMYTEQDWEDYVSGKSVRGVESIKITRGESDLFFIDVYISGSARSGSGSGYTADSTNPKTGDMIFTPVIIMGASVSALAVLFYLNKKRAF